jgi:hypothetical protein
MKVYLDDERETPEGFIRTYTVEETIKLLQTRQVEELSLDNDLGEGLLEGHKVLDWLEESVFHDDTFPIPMIGIHSANASRVEYMHRAVKSIHHIRSLQSQQTH